MKKLLIVAGALTTLIIGAGEANAKKWTYNVIEVKDGKTTVVLKDQSNCNYARAVSQARVAVDNNPNRFFNLTSTDDAQACPKVARMPKADKAATAQAH